MKHTIKQWRILKGFTQREIANKIGISTQTYNAWENNIEELPISKIKIIANALSIDWDDIFLP